MSRKEVLIRALSFHAAEEWANVASTTLSGNGVKSDSEEGAFASTSVQDLLRTYTIRLDRSAKEESEAHGMRELVDSLSNLPAEDVVAIEVFSTTQRA